MNETELAKHSAFRREKMESFIREPGKFKVCDQCQSIALLAAPACPVCKAYRWRVTAAEVIETAKLIGSNPFPLTSGIVPRFR